MPNSSQRAQIKTSAGRLSYRDSGGKGFPCFLIHGNSSSSRIFDQQFDALGADYRLIAVDLPGHGQSERPAYPEQAYTIPGYAQALDEVSRHLELDPFAVAGHSLGGNIALQWTQLAPGRIQKVLLIASAPIPYSAEAYRGYPPYEGNYAACGDALTEEQAKSYLGACGFQVDDPECYFAIEDAMKTDGLSRSTMVASVLAGKGMDETRIVAQFAGLVGVVLGSDDPAVGLEYVAQLPYGHLWRGQVQIIQNARHALPLHQASALNQILSEFLELKQPNASGNRKGPLHS